MKRDFVAETDFTTKEIDRIFELCGAMKNKKIAPKPLQGKTVGCIFHKASLRTRVSFEVGVAELGGSSFYITKRGSSWARRDNLRRRQSTLPLSAMITIRTFAHRYVSCQLGARYGPIMP